MNSMVYEIGWFEKNLEEKRNRSGRSLLHASVCYLILVYEYKEETRSKEDVAESGDQN